MAYTLQHTYNNLTPIVVPDGQLDKSTSLTFVGKTVQNYGGIIDQNFLQLLENFASPFEPGTTNGTQGIPVRGQIWCDVGTNTLKYYDGTGFKKIGGAFASAVEPGSTDATRATVSEGDLWLDNSNTSNPLLKMRSNNQWVTVGPAGAQATVTGELILDNNLQTHEVITFNIDGKRHAILSNDETTYRTRTSATDSSPIPGFYTVGPGFNINDTGDVLGNRFWGTATGAERILLPQPPGLGDVYLTAHDFIRANVAGFTTGSLTVKNNNGLTLGANNQVTMSITNTDYNINNIANNSNIRFNTKDSGGTSHNVLNMFGNGNATFGGDLNLIGGLNVNQISTVTLALTGNYNSNSTASGTFIVTGGAGIGGNVNIGGNIRAANNAIFSGSIGIGTANVSVINNRTSVTINGVTDNIISLKQSETLKAYIQTTSSEFNIATSGVPLRLQTLGSNSIRFITNGSDRMRVNEYGNVGIAVPISNFINYTLQVDGTINANGNISEFGRPTLNTANYTNYAARLDGNNVVSGSLWDINITGSVGGTALHAAEAYRLNLGNENETKLIIGNTWAGASGAYAGYIYSGSGNTRFGFSATAGVCNVYADGDFYANEGVNLVLNLGNYNTYVPTLTGTGASGSWNINALTATTAAALVTTNDYTVQNITATLDVWANRDLHVLRNAGVVGYITSGSYISAVGDIYAFNTSDRNLKTKIKPIKNALDKVCELSGNTFEWTAEQLEKIPENFRKAQDVGVIAQEVQQVLPEAVMTRPDGTLAVDYVKIVPLLVEAIKELRTELAEIKKPSLLDKLKGKK